MFSCYCYCSSELGSTESESFVTCQLSSEDREAVIEIVDPMKRKISPFVAITIINVDYIHINMK